MTGLLEALELGGGRVEKTSTAGCTLTLPADRTCYANAQLDDYRTFARRAFKWRPPLHFELNGMVSSPQPPGTLGFGFWNDPFALMFGQGGSARRIPALPQAAWFFYGSPPNDLSLGGSAPGAGWLAMTIRSKPIPAALLALPILAAWPSVQIPPLRATLFKIARSFVHIESCEVGVTMDDWHRYAINWLPEGIEFIVDKRVVLANSSPPRSPLGFVAWIDNQYLCASPAAGLRFGVLPTTSEQQLELERIAFRTAE